MGRALTTWLTILAACGPKELAPDEPAGPEATTGEVTVPAPTVPTTGSTTLPPTPPTAGEPAVVGFPYAPYDCSLGVPAPPFEVRFMEDTVSGEDITFDYEGYLLAPDT